MDPTEQEQLVLHFERLCTAVYEPDDSLPSAQMTQQVKMAQNKILKMVQQDAYFQQVQVILLKTSNNYAIAIATNAYRDFMTQKWFAFKPDERMKVRAFVWTVLRQKLKILTRPSRVALIRLITRITKMGWFEDQRHKETVNEALKLLSPDFPATYCLGIDLLAQLVDEMNKPLRNETLTDHRKTAVSFRELSLKIIFKAALSCIKQVSVTNSANVDPATKINMSNVGVNLAVQCLQYDFIGTNPDDSMIEMSNIHVPATWRAIMQDQTVIPVMFDIYKSSTPLPSGEFPQYVSKLMELMALMAIVRRSIFSPEKERMRFLQRMIQGACEVLISRHGLKDPAVYHQFCRFLGKLKSNYQLTELVNTEGYQRWISLASQFSTESFNRWQLSASSAHYILQLWSRMVSAMPYVREDSGSGGHLLKDYVPRVITAYIKGKLHQIDAAVKFDHDIPVVGIEGEVENPLNDPEVLDTHLQFLPFICRYQYREVAEFLVTSTAALWGKTKAAVQQSYEQRDKASLIRRKIFEHQLAWMTYICSALVAGRLPAQNRRTDIKEELIDADLSKNIFVMVNTFQLWRSKQSRLNPAFRPEPHLELSLLHFFDTFQKTYVGEHRGMPPLGSSLISAAAPNEKQQMYLRYFERLGMGQHTEVIEKIITRLGENLQDWANVDEVIGKTLDCFTSFVCGYSSGRMLLELPTVRSIIDNHSERRFAFLRSAESSNISEHRAKFFTALARLIWLMDGEPKFEQFMEMHVKVLRNCDKANFSNPQALRAMISTCRDLLGVAKASHNGRTYRMVFNSIHPILFRVMDKALAEAGHVPALSIAVLTLMGELVENKTQRIQFNHCSPDGILLFKYTSKLCCTYVKKMDGRTFADAYEEKYNPLGLLFEMLHHSLNGKYVNFGVFTLYKDPCLIHMVDASILYIAKSPYDEMRKYPRVHQALCAYLEALFSNHLDLLMRQYNANAIMELLAMTFRGLTGLDEHVATVCSSAIDHFASYVFEKKRFDPKQNPYTAKVARCLSLNPNNMYKILEALFRIVLYTESGNQWSLSKPILSLMLADNKSYKQLERHYLETQAINMDARAKMGAAFQALTKDIRPNLEQGNRDRFSQHVSQFRTTILPLLKR